MSPLHSAIALSVVCGTVLFAQQAAPAKPAAPTPARPAAAAPAAPSSKPATAVIDSKRPIMQAEEMSLSGTTPIFGDRSQAGPYIVRSALAAKAAARPHFVDQDQFITVLKGTLWIGKGDVFNPSKLQPIREGGVIFLPANTHYFQVAGSESEVVVQISGNGPAKSTHTEVDAKGQAVAENGPYPSLAPPPRRRNVDPDLLTPDEIEQMERAAAAAKAAAAKKAAAEEKK